MNIDDAARQSKIDLDDEEKDVIEDDLDDVITLLNELKAFKPDERTTTSDIELRDDEPHDEDFQHTSDHTDGDTIRSPDP